jgi:type I phosphodiesterase/nucleotide pyrophosphatase
MIARRLGAIVAAAITVGAVGAATAAATAEPDVNRRPLVITLVVDGLDGDSVDAGRAPFLSSLLTGQDARSTYFQESRAIMPTVTNANHVAMMSGAYAGQSGNPGNEFAIYAPLEHEDSCAATGPMNSRALPTPTTGESRNCPQAQMVFEAIKRQGNPDELVTAAIFGKPVVGRIFAGRNVDPRRTDADHLWAPCDESPEDDEYCAEVPTNPITGYSLEDSIVMDEVVRVLQEGVPADGEMKRPDFAFVNLPQVDLAGHGFGPGGVYDEAIAMADDEIERLVSTLQALGEWERTVLIVVSDHSMDTTPTKVDLNDVIEAAGVPEDRFLVTMGDNGMAAHVYVPDRKSPDRFALLKQIRDAVIAEPTVAGALYREPNPADGGRANSLKGARPEWRVEGERSGDLFVTAKTGALFAGSGDSGNFAQGHHGSTTTRDNFFAVIGGSSLVRQRSIAGVAAPDFEDTAANPKQAENVDVAATVMGLFGLFAPADDEGRFLKQAFNREVLREVALPERPRLRVRDAPGSRLVLRPRPRGGEYDLEQRVRGRWKELLDREEANKVKVRGERGDRATFRLRSISAASVKSRWRRENARF